MSRTRRISAWALSLLLCFCGKANFVSAAPGDGHWDRQFGMPGTSTYNYALCVHKGRIYTAGFNYFYGAIAANTSIHVFNGTNWTQLGEFSGEPAVIYDIVFVGAEMYVGGIFRAVCSVPALGLARWDGTNWRNVAGFEGTVYALATDGTNLYVGGWFTNAGGRAITNIAKWDGTNWCDLGGVGLYQDFYKETVRTLVWRDGKLYVGGWFTVAGGVPATNLAVWDGQTWAQIGGGVGDANGLVAAIAFHGNHIYVGGRFSRADTVPAQNIARWNGLVWEPLGSGLISPTAYGVHGSTPVTSLAFLGPDLIAVGTFTNAGGVTATRVAKWDGARWSALGGLNDLGTRAVAQTGAVYICGLFNMASNLIASRIVRWTGSGWEPVEGETRNGTHTFVHALAVGNDGLYMGAGSLRSGEPRQI